MKTAILAAVILTVAAVAGLEHHKAKKKELDCALQTAELLSGKLPPLPEGFVLDVCR